MTTPSPEPTKVPLDLDRLALVIGRGVIENIGLQQQLEDAQRLLAQVAAAAADSAPDKPGNA